MPRNVYCDQCRKDIGDEKLAYFSDIEKNLDFCSEECYSEWKNESSFAHYLESKGYNPQQENLNLEELREEYNKSGQKWLDQNYLDKEERILSIYLNQQLEGVLDCSEYKSLERIFISSSIDSSKLEIKKGSWKAYWGKSETQIFSCMPAQTWLDENYPKNGTCVRQEFERTEHESNHEDFGKTREEIKELDIRSEYETPEKNKSLEGELDLSDFKNLEELRCSLNCLTNLKLNNCLKLRKIVCYNNQLATLDLGNLAELEELQCSDNYLTQITYPTNPKKITNLDINSNNINSSDLTIFSEFENLERLEIGNWDKTKINQGIYNRFYGSLEPLKDLNKLEKLYIHNTDIDSGWEYLPESINIRDFYYSADERPESKVKELRNLWKYCGEDVKKYRELIKDTSAQEWLDENYPLDETCKNKSDEENYSKKKRSEITELDISNKDLKGGLRFKGFANLKWRLYCQNNQLTHLDLGDCENLKWLDASDNNLSSLHFLELVPNLKDLHVNNNSNLPKDGLKIIAKLKELNDLRINDCPFEGSLKQLESLSKLEKLDITNTNFSEGLEYLPESLRYLCCDSESNSKSYQIVKELEKHSEGKEYGYYYNFPKWLKNQRNSVATTVPLERLYVIRGNLMRFLNKWGTKPDSKISEVTKLQNPQEISTYWYVGESSQWISRVTAVTGGILAATTNPVLGGILAATSPVVEVFSTQLKERLYEEKEKKWDAYSEDLEDLLNNYHELLGIIETIVIGEKGEVNTALQELKDTIEAFLKRYDEDKNRMIDIEELKTEVGKNRFAEDLDKKNNHLQRIIDTIEDVKTEVINYHKRNEKDKEEIKLIKKEQIEIGYMLRNAIEMEIRKSFPEKEVIFLLNIKETQFLVISQSISKYALDLVEIKEGDLEIKKSSYYSNLFSSQKEVLEKALELIELTEEQQSIIWEKSQKNYWRKKNKEEGELSTRSQERLAELLEEILLEKEIKKFEESKEKLDKKTDELVGKFTLCNLCRLTREYLNRKQTETVNNQNQETKQLQTNIEIPPK
jgi:hypothetical protein